MNERQKFRAVLEPSGDNLKWTIARVPFRPQDVWASRRGMRVRGTINGYAFRTSLFGSATKGYCVLVNKVMQKESGTRPGQSAEFVLEPDLGERELYVPPELAKVLKQDRAMTRWFEALSPSTKKYLADEVGKPKNAETRKSRAERVAERILLAMEGEHTLPPILRVAFGRETGAEAGWEAMTPVQRRSHLLGIFYYQAPEARERRAAKAVADALLAAKRS
jgi:hypothetical protein